MNVLKLALLAALAPAVIAGIAARASVLEAAGDPAALVAVTMSAGALCAMLGALASGALTDFVGIYGVRRWAWVLAATTIGTLGLLTVARASTPAALIGGWALAQFGYSGSMATARTILAEALPAHRRRGAVVSVLGSYGGLLVPIVVLLIFPGRIWETTFGLAVVSLAVPIVFILGSRRASPDAGRRQQQDPSDADEHAEARRGTRNGGLSRPQVLIVQMATNVVIAAFLAYQPLELASRSGTDSQFPARASVAVVGAALAGLALATLFLLFRVSPLVSSRRIVVWAGLLLAVSLVLRAGSETFPLIMVAAIMSGIAIGLISSALFSAALDCAQRRKGARFIGMYSAAGALGQFLGPVAGFLALQGAGGLNLLPLVNANEYRFVMLMLATVPTLWACALILKFNRSRT